MKTIIFFIVMLAVIIIGPKKNINCGILGLGAAFICGCVFLGYGTNQIIALFPTRLLFMIMNAAIFYGFASANGTMEKIAGHMMYACRKYIKFMPFVVYLVDIVLCAFGAGTAHALIMSPIAFSIAAQLGYDPLLAALACWCGVWMDSAIWTADFAWFSGWIGEYSTPEVGYKVMCNEWWLQAIFFTLIFIAAYIWKKGYKIGEGKSLIIEKPEPMDGKQKITFFTILAIIAIIVVPAFIDQLAPNPVTTWFVTYATIQPLCSIGSIILAFAHAADVRDVVKNRVPWEIILMVCGVSTLMGMCADLGVIDACTAILTKVPSFLIIPLIVGICAFLSFFVAGMSVLALLYPLNQALATAAGTSIVAVFQSIDLGLNISSFSPFSMGGSLCLTGVGPDVDKSKLMSDMMKVAVIQSVVLTLFSIVGFTRLGA